MDRKDIKKVLPILWAAGLLTVLLASCRGSTSSSAPGTFGRGIPVNSAGSYINLTPQELNQLHTEQDTYFVNVHIPYEGEIPDTDAFIPFNEIERYATKLPAAPDAPIVVYCRSGSMSASAAEQLVRMGYTRVYNLNGGFRAWSEAGFSLISP